VAHAGAAKWEEMMSQTNRKPPDELADVREQMKELKVREAELRDMLIDGACDLVGDDYAATVSKVISERVDTVRLRKELGTERLRPYLVPSESVVVKVERVKGQME
jgi:predicted phage-related endonuclease